MEDWTESDMDEWMKLPIVERDGKIEECVTCKCKQKVDKFIYNCVVCKNKICNVCIEEFKCGTIGEDTICNKCFEDYEKRKKKDMEKHIRKKKI